ncbi:MAG: LacI family DNA-binding transcriptional regulator [Acidobacteriaceae bacterium]
MLKRSDRKSGHVTLSDVARACRLSVSTVSIVLSQAPLSLRLAQTTRERIHATALRLGYHPDAYARSLRNRSTRTIGVLAYDMSDPFCVPVIRGIEQDLQPLDYFSLLVDAQTERKLFDSSLRMILERRAEGVIVIASWIFEEANLLADVKKNRVPIVIVGRDLTERRIPSFLVDNQAGGAMAINHLLALGHRRIAVIRGPDDLFDSQPRWTGIQQAAAQAGVPLDPRLVVSLPNRVDPTSGFDGGLKLARQMISSSPGFTAVLAFDDLTALGVVRGLKEEGVRVPEDCSVIGFDDILPAAVCTPGLTTIRQPLHDMGSLATQRLLHVLQRPNRENPSAHKPHMLAPELVVRSSSAPPPARQRARSAPTPRHSPTISARRATPTQR